LPVVDCFVQVVGFNFVKTDTGATIVNNPLKINQTHQLSDTSRLWVSLNDNTTVDNKGEYISPTYLKIDYEQTTGDNTLIIMKKIKISDDIIITSMVSSASPTETKFRIHLDKFNGDFNQHSWGTDVWGRVWSPDTRPNPPAVVHRENQPTRTYLLQGLVTTFLPSDQLVVADPYRLVDVQTTNFNIGTPTLEINVTGTTSYKITSITVMASGTPITDFSVQVINNNTVKLIFETSVVGLIDVTVVTGNSILIDGEQIGFSLIDMSTGVISGLRRGTNGTIVNKSFSEGAVVRGILPSNIMDGAYYIRDWYSASDNTIPLQYSVSEPADFLNVVV
jgi:hypothetical protein